MILCGLIGFTIERLAYRPIRKAPRLNALITAIGVSLFLQNVGQLKWTIVPAEREVAQGKGAGSRRGPEIGKARRCGHDRAADELPDPPSAWRCSDGDSA
jgi:branched-subunit amino acid ABC-type transport system permease component